MAFNYDNPVGIFNTTVVFSGSQLDAFNTTPLEIVPAPGANLVILPLRITSVFIQTGSNIYGQDAGIASCWNNTQLPNPPDTNAVNPNSTTSGHPILTAWDHWGNGSESSPGIYAHDISAGINQPLKIQANFDWNTVGEPLTTHLSNPGTAYNPGDVSNPGGSGTWQITVDTVTGGPPGPIATYHISAAELPGVGYPVGTSLDLADVSSGDAVIVIDSIQPGTNGKFYVHVQYSIFPVT